MWKVAGEYLCFAKARALQHKTHPGRCVRLHERTQLFEILQNARSKSEDTDGDEFDDEVEPDVESELIHLSLSG